MNRLEELMQAYLDDALTPEEQTELLESLQRSPEETDELVALHRQERELAHLHRGADSAAFVRRVVDDLGRRQQEFVQPVMSSVRRAGRPSRSRRSRRQRLERRPFAWAWLAAAGAAAAALMLFARSLPEHDTKAPGRGTVAPLSTGADSRSPDSRLRIMAIVEQGTADVRVGDGSWRPMGNRQPVAAGDAVRSGALSQVRLTYEDGTAVVLDADAEARFQEGLTLARGALCAKVAPQKSPFVIVTPQADLTVLGTEFRIALEPDSAHFVLYRGRVRLRHRESGQEIELAPNDVAVAKGGAGFERHQPPVLAWLREHGRLRVLFGVFAPMLPAGTFQSSAAAFDPALGLGWDGPIELLDVPESLAGAAEVRRKLVEPAPLAGMPSRGTFPPTERAEMPTMHFVCAGGTDRIDTWRLPVPDGRYRVTVGVGNGWSRSGPHHVRVEDVLLIDRRTAPTRASVTATADVLVRDGELTLRVGGHGARLAPDQTGATLLSELTVERLSPEH